MATQDYVKRGRAKKQVRKNNKRRTKPKKQPVPWLRVGAAAAVLAGFSYGLYWLQTEQDIEQVQIADISASEPTEEIIVENETDISSLPVLQEEEWAFIDSLPEQSVEVDVDELPD